MLHACRGVSGLVFPEFALEGRGDPVCMILAMAARLLEVRVTDLGWPTTAALDSLLHPSSIGSHLPRRWDRSRQNQTGRGLGWSIGGRKTPGR